MILGYFWEAHTFFKQHLQVHVNFILNYRQVQAFFNFSNTGARVLYLELGKCMWTLS